MKFILLSLIVVSNLAYGVDAQHFDAIQVGNKSPITSKSVLDINSTTAGALIPRMTTTQKNAISSPPDGLLIYDTTLHALCEYNSSLSAWSILTPGTTAALTASKAVVTNSSSLLSSSATTATEVGYLSGVTSAIQTQLGGKLSLTGGTMSGSLDMGSHLINNVTDPSSAQDAATKNYIDTNPLFIKSFSGMAYSTQSETPETWGAAAAGIFFDSDLFPFSHTASGYLLSTTDTTDGTRPVDIGLIAGSASTGGNANGADVYVASGSGGDGSGRAGHIVLYTGFAGTDGGSDSGIVLNNDSANYLNPTNGYINLQGKTVIDLNAPTINIRSSGNDISFGGSKAGNLGNPVISTDAANKSYVDTHSGGGINYVSFDSSYLTNNKTNSDAETSIGDWTAYADAAGAVPVNMTGGSPNSTCLQTTTAGHILNGAASFEVVKSANNRQGEGCSNLVYVPPGYRGQNAQITIPFAIFSGSLASDALIISAYDVTNSALIPVSHSSITANGLLVGNLVIPSTTAQMRIGFHFASTSATAVTFDFDDVTLGPPTNVGNVQVVSPWKNDLTFTTSGFGTLASSDFRYRQVGDSIHVRGYIVAGTVAASTAYIQLPTGYTIDTSKMGSGTNATLVGRPVEAASGGTADVIDNSNKIGLYLFYDGSTNNQLFFSRASASNQFTKQNGSTFGSSNDLFTVDFTVPISQWSGSVTGFNAGQIANSWSGYHDNDCSWSRTSSVLADPAIDASCTLVEKTNVNFGTVTSYNDGTTGNNLPGLTWTPSSLGTYLVMATIEANGSSAITNGLTYNLWDGTTEIAQVRKDISVTNVVEQTPLIGIYKVTSTSSKSIRIQMKNGAGNNVSINTGDTFARAINWTIVKIDSSIPSPYLINGIVTPAQAVTSMTGAIVASDGSVTETTGEWINGNCSKSSSVYTCTLDANIFSSNVSCNVSPYAGVLAEAVLDTTSKTQVIVRTFNVGLLPTDEAFQLICVGQH